MAVIIADIETTGLDLFSDKVLEISALILDDQLTTCYTYFNQHVFVPAETVDEWVRGADPYVQKMHEDNGLWEACRVHSPDSQLIYPVALVDMFYEWSVAKTEEYADEFQEGEKRLNFVGDSNDFDNSFLFVANSGFWQHYNYHLWNLSAPTDMARVWNPALFQDIQYAADDNDDHRALGDCVSTWHKALIWKHLIVNAQVPNEPARLSDLYSDEKRGYTAVSYNMMRGRVPLL